MLLLLLCGVTCRVSAQYFQTGQTSMNQRWMQLRSGPARMIYPQEFDRRAREAMFYAEAVIPNISYGFSRGPLAAPVVFKSESLFSNGLAMLAPKRIEMIGFPAMSGYSTPWLKHLTVHEYRHMVQYAAMNRNTVRVLSYIFGQQATLVATGTLPFWFIEGDAVLAETQASSYGRALQPSFTMHYRALGREILERRNPDKWFSGSYRDYVPSHYEQGYQMAAHSYRKYGPRLWDDITEYSSKYPFLVFTTQLGLRKYAGVGSKQLFRETFSELNGLWESLPETGDTAEAVTPAPQEYISYSHPLFTDDGTIIALKSDYRRPARLVRIDAATGEEERIAYTGSVSSRPAYRDGLLWWSEFRRSLLWEQKTFSYIYYMDVRTGKTGRLDGPDVAFYPTPTPSGEPAYISYGRGGTFSYVHGVTQFDFGPEYSVHGLAWDDVSDTPYVILLGDRGMSIAGIGADMRLFPVTEPAHVTIGDLRAQGGKLYFNSILSGRDEAHMIDLASGREYRLTESRYGSFSPAPSPDGSLAAVTVYSRNGYGVGLQRLSGKVPVTPAKLPANLVNMPLPEWETVNIDEVEFTAQDAEESERTHKARRFRRLPHMFNLHSWAPLYFEPDNIINGTDINVTLGATLISQSLLEDAISSLGYGYTAGGHSMLRASIDYLGSIPRFEVAAVWSDEPQRVGRVPSGETIPRLRDYMRVSARAYLPMLLSNGYVTRRLTPSVEYLYVNNIQWGEGPVGYERIDYASLMAASIRYSASVRTAALDLYPRWGWVARAALLTRPGDRRFSNTVDVYGRIYVPGIVRHHGVTLAASWQEATDKAKFMYSSMSLIPRGYTSFTSKKYMSVSATYALPLAYPDGGWSGVFFLKRIWMDAGFDFAAFIPDMAGADPSARLFPGGAQIWSWGGTLNMDVVFFRMPSQAATTLSVSCFKRRGSGSPVVSVGFTVPL